MNNDERERCIGLVLDAEKQQYRERLERAAIQICAAHANWTYENVILAARELLAHVDAAVAAKFKTEEPDKL